MPRGVCGRRGSSAASAGARAWSGPHRDVLASALCKCEGFTSVIPHGFGIETDRQCHGLEDQTLKCSATREPSSDECIETSALESECAYGRSPLNPCSSARELTHKDTSASLGLRCVCCGGVYALRGDRRCSRPNTAAHVRSRRTPHVHPDGTANEPGSCVGPGGQRLSLQESYDPHGVAFASGPSNPKGLGLRSFRSEVVEAAGPVLDAEFVARSEHQGFPGIVGGGVLGALAETHMNWCAAVAVMDHFATPSPPLTVSQTYTVDLVAPTPVGEPLLLRAKVMGADADYKALNICCGVYRRAAVGAGGAPSTPPSATAAADSTERAASGALLAQTQARGDGSVNWGGADWKDEGALHIDGYVLTARAYGRFRKIGPLRAIR